MRKRYTFLPKSWQIIGLVAVFAVSGAVSSYAQNAPVKVWDKTIGGSYNDGLSCIQQTFDGGYILGGSSDSNIGGDKGQNCKGYSDYWIVKLDVNGNKVWDKTIGGNSLDHLSSLQETKDKGYILGGISNSPVSGDKSQASQGGIYDYWVVKLDSVGNKLWDRRFGGSDEEYLYAVKQTSDNGYILGGYSHSGISGDKSEAKKGTCDFWIVRLDSVGNKLWDKTLGGSSVNFNYSKLHALQQTKDGGYILGGFSTSDIGGDKSQNSRGSEDYWVLKLDSAGNKLWDKTFGGSSSEQLYSLQQISDGGYILGGWSSSGISGDKSQVSQGGLGDYWVVKLDSSGNKIWDKTFGGNSEDYLATIKQTPDGGYILGGISKSGISSDKSEISRGGEDYWIVKLDANGNKLWDKTLGGNNDEGLSSLLQISDGGYILAGSSNTGISGDKSQVSKGGSDYWIIKIGGKPLGLNITEATIAISISPNPSQGKFKLQLNNISASKVEVSVTDLLGRIILQKELQVANKLVSEELEIKAAKGIYLLQIKAGNQTTSRKLVVE